MGEDGGSVCSAHKFLQLLPEVDHMLLLILDNSWCKTQLQENRKNVWEEATTHSHSQVLVLCMKKVSSTYTVVLLQLLYVYGNSNLF